MSNGADTPERRSEMAWTKVGLYHYANRKLPWLVRWYGEIDPKTGKPKRYGKSFRIKRFSLWVAKSSIVVSGSFSITVVSSVVFTLVEESSIAINGFFPATIVFCIAFTFHNM